MLSSLFTKSMMKTYGYWLFVIVGGIFLILIEEADIEPMFSLMTFIYVVLVNYWAARWILNQIKSLIARRKEKINLELLHLKSQVNPHFFFNTLNNLYGTISKDSEKAKQMVLTLSEMMRYGLYDGQKEWVALEDEIKYLKNYIDLHKDRYHKVVDIQFTHTVEESGIKVMPLLFIILLENAFKHGVENLREKAFVHIDLRADLNEIRLFIKNNFDPTIPKEVDGQGIGLQNLQRRLEIVYPKHHSLICTPDEDIYSAELILYTK